MPDNHERDEDRADKITIDIGGRIRLCELHDSVVSSILAPDGASVTVMLRGGEMDWTLSYQGTEWHQRVVYRRNDGQPAAVSESGPPVVSTGGNGGVSYSRPGGRLKRSKPLTVDQITGADQN